MAQCLECGTRPAVDGHLVCWHCADTVAEDSGEREQLPKNVEVEEWDSRYLRPAEWLTNGDSRWALSDQSMRQVEEDIITAGKDEHAGWLTTEAILVASGCATEEDLTDLVRLGILETVVEGDTRLYRRKRR